MRPDVLGVIGLGAIGGSVAWQSARAGIRRVIGYSPWPKECAAAARVGAVTDIGRSPTFLARHADLLIVAAPPAATLDLIGRLGEIGGSALCTDVTSVKAPVMAAARRAGVTGRFAGSHPFVGTHQRGFRAATADRFRDALVYVTPLGDDGPAREIADFWASVLEAAPVIVDPHDHDRLVAWTSHLPQAVASALAVALAGSGPRGVQYGRGAQDTTRLAASSTEMWRDVLMLNRTAILQAIEQFDDSIGELRRALMDGSPERVADWLERGARWRRRLPT